MSRIHPNQRLRISTSAELLQNMEMEQEEQHQHTSYNIDYLLTSRKALKYAWRSLQLRVCFSFFVDSLSWVEDLLKGSFQVILAYAQACNISIGMHCHHRWPYRFPRLQFCERLCPIFATLSLPLFPFPHFS